MVSKTPAMERRPTFKDFEIDEGLFIREALIIVDNNLVNYSTAGLKKVAEQLGVPAWQEIDDHYQLAFAIRRQHGILSEHADDEEILDRRPISNRPITVYIIENTDSGITLSRVFDGLEEYSLHIIDGIPRRMINYYPDFTILTVFDNKGNLTKRLVNFSIINLEVIDTWSDKGRVRTYKSGSDKITQKEAFELVRELSREIKEATNIIEPVTEIISSYLLTI